jgi:ATP-binding cassette subfamily F protein uup
MLFWIISSLMNLLSVDGLKKAYGDRVLFENVSFGLDEGDKAAIIGVNGCGKSTLLKMISGREDNDGGNVAVNKSCIINYLSQTPESEGNETVIDFIFKGDSPVTRLVKRYEQLCADPKADPDELNKLTEDMEHRNAWSYEYSVKSVLGELGIHDYKLKMNELSGGMAKKVALAQALIDEGTLLIMDEPTNHLDIETVEWLQGFLEGTKQAVLLVTHDRYFLDSVCNVIFEIEDGVFRRYEGNYSTYLEKKAEEAEHEQRRQDRLSNILRNELQWLKRSPKARSTKQKARIGRAEELQESVVRKNDKELELATTGRRLGGKIADLKSVSKSYGEKKLFADFSYSFKPGEKLGIAGPNGAGKSTFLKILTGEEQPDSGTVDIGVNTFFGIFDQHSKALDPDIKMIDYIDSIAKNVKTGSGDHVGAGIMLERFLFPKDSHYRPIGRLSGGEKRRLLLVGELIKNPNFLILDEPTNDLDIKTLSVLEDFLTSFAGCAVVVSHDRYFMDRVCDTLFVFKGEAKFEHFPGSYSQYLEKKKAAPAEIKEKKQEARPKQTEKKKLTYAEKIEFQALKGEIEKMETELEAMHTELAKGGSDYTRLSELQTRIDETENLLLEKMERYEHLSELT